MVDYFSRRMTIDWPRHFTFTLLLILLSLNQMSSFVPRPHPFFVSLAHVQNRRGLRTRLPKSMFIFMLDIATNCWKMHVKYTNMYISLVHKDMLTDTGGIDIEYIIHYFKDIYIGKSCANQRLQKFKMLLKLLQLD